MARAQREGALTLARVAGVVLDENAELNALGDAELAQQRAICGLTGQSRTWPRPQPRLPLASERLAPPSPPTHCPIEGQL